ncbi:MAG TPA: hypothetical protein VFO06_08895 [Gemmatimonadales bacterium]|nr:hypothetical protein [Gemmatimonadales bacterium]
MTRILPVLLLLAACQAGGGKLTARWIGEQDTASFQAPVTASWCEANKRLDLFAMRGDSGIGLALYPVDSAQLAATYTVTEPGGPIQVRPGAGVAIRWFGKTAVVGFWGREGTITVTQKKRGRLGVDIDAKLVSSVLDGPTLALTGSGNGIQIEPDTSCANAGAVPSPGPAVPGPFVPDSAAREID